MPPLSTITLLQTSASPSPICSSRRKSLSLGSSAEFCTTEEKLKQATRVSFNPRVRVIETHYSETSQHIFDPSKTWFTEQDIDEFSKSAFHIIQRFQRSWHLREEDCLRGLESQTTKCTATKVRIHVYKDLLLAKKDFTKRMLEQSPGKVRHMMCLILKQAEQEALELAQLDAQEALNYQLGIQEDLKEESSLQEQPFKCFFWELPKWLAPKRTPVLEDVSPV